MTAEREIFVSVDVETAGPIPGEYSLLSIGACDVDDESRTFACEIKPINRNADPKALEISGFSSEALERSGLTPAAAMLTGGYYRLGLRLCDRLSKQVPGVSNTAYGSAGSRRDEYDSSRKIATYTE